MTCSQLYNLQSMYQIQISTCTTAASLILFFVIFDTYPRLIRTKSIFMFKGHLQALRSQGLYTVGLESGCRDCSNPIICQSATVFHRDRNSPPKQELMWRTGSLDLDHRAVWSFMGTHSGQSKDRFRYENYRILTL